MRMAVVVVSSLLWSIIALVVVHWIFMLDFGVSGSLLGLGGKSGFCGWAGFVS